MSYTKTTDFQAKDALASGNPSKIVKGTEIDNEFDAIQIADALNLKRDGTTTASADIPMGSHKFTGLSAGTTAGDSVRYEQFASPPAIGGTVAAAVTGTTVTATTQFSGPGTGLSGTAASLSIGGNAATATSATSATTATNLAGGGAGQVPYQSAVGTTAMLAAGTTGQVYGSNGTSAPAWRNALIATSESATTSGTSVDITSIPSWVRRITVLFDSVSTNGTSNLLIQIGDSGGVETSGYVSYADRVDGVVSSSTAGFIITPAITAATSNIGAIVLTNMSTNKWVAFGSIGENGGTIGSSAGIKTLSATLDRIRLTTVGGADTFDAGAINIVYE